ncbi:translation initiation factor eIF 4e-like domain-containing protein [Phlebopus sp. FC_14]|nr:translation initiation factor eIF 4e-like domain-containing protein [Phlebopus sp. FC_14]
MSSPTKESDDPTPKASPYAWSKDSSLSLNDFLAKYKPSMVQNDGTKPWLWVRGEKELPIPEGVGAAVHEAATLLQEVAAKVEEVKNDDSIPMRSSKKTGAKSKKEVREQVQAEAAEKLRDISKKYNYVCGKWLIFAPPERVDAIWTTVASSLIYGSLASTSAFCTKVATSPQHETPGHQHVICLYIPDIYDKSSATEVMKILLRNHGLNLSGAKSDLYTSIGLDSKHASGIPSTVWKNTALLTDSEIKELKDAYFAELAASKTTEAEPKEAESMTASKPAEEKRKPALKKKKVEAEDPFASDDEGEEATPPCKTKNAEPKNAPARTSKRPQEGDGEGEAMSQFKPKRKKTSH